MKATSSADLLIDVQGYYTSGNPAAGGFVPVSENRIVDTRNGTGLPSAPLTSGSTTSIQVGGLAGVPSNASAVMLNFLVANQTAAGNFVAYPSDAASSPQQFLHFDGDVSDSTSQAVALSATSPTTGDINLKLTVSDGGTADIVVDVLGYFTPSQSAGLFTPAAARVYDSRSSGNTSLAAGAIRTIQVAGVAGVPSSGIGAIATNIDIFDPNGTNGGWTHVWPDSQAEPDPSMAVSYGAGRSASNFLTVALGADGGINIHNMGSDAIDFAVDVQGWYTPANLINVSARDSSGNADAGASVSVTAWPNSQTLDALADGADVPTTTVATGYTDSAGNFSANPDLSTLDPATYAETGGSVQLEVDIVDNQGYVQQLAFSAAEPTSDDAINGAAASVLAPEEMSVDLKSKQITETTGTAASDSYATPQTTPNAGYVPGDWYCLPYKKTEHIVRNERFYNLYAFGKSQVAEETGAAHQVAVGVNIDDQGWGIDSTVAIDTTSSSGGTLSFNNNHTLYNSMNVAKFDQDCYSSSGGIPYHNHKVEATSLHDLMVSYPSIQNRSWNQNNCGPVRTSGDWYKTSGRDQKFSAGISTPWIGLSTQAAYSKHMRVDWYPPSSGEVLCGSNNLGFASAPFAGGYSANTGCGGSGPAGESVDINDGSAADLTANDGTVDAYSTAPLC